MPAIFPVVEDLPLRAASQVKNGWADVTRQVRESGGVAVTNHGTIEMVLIDAAQYRLWAGEVQALRARERTALDELERAFDARLHALQSPDTGAAVDAMFAGRGRLKQPLKAGPSF